jgi:hypothetical protein
MAFLNAGASATTPGNPDPRFALHTREGVADRTGLGDEMTRQMNYQIGSSAVQAAGEVITAGYKGYNIAQLEKQINDEAVKPFLQGIDPEFQSQRDKTVAESQGMLSGYSKQKEGIFQNMMDNDVDPIQSLSEMEPGVQKESQKLKAALGQGRMTQAEFELRLRKVTREAINRNPGLTQELLAHAQLVEHQSGIRQIKDPAQALDKAEAKQAEARNKLFISQAKAVGVYIDPNRMDDPNYQALMAPQVQQAHQDISNYNETKRMKADGEIAENYTGKQRARLAPSVVRGAYHTAIDNFTQVAGEATSGNEAAKKDAVLNMKLYRNQAVLDLGEELHNQGLLPGDVDRHVKSFTDMLDYTIDNVSQDVSGELLSKTLGNTRSILTSTQENNVLRNHDVAAWKLTSLIGTNPEFVAFLRNNPEIAKQTQANYSNVLTGILNQGSLDTLYERNLNPNMSDAAWLTSQALKSGNNEAAGKIIDTAKQLTVDFADKNFGANVQQKVASQWDIIREIGKLKDTENVSLSTPDKASFTALTGDFLNYAGTRFNREITKLEEDPNINVITRFGKDGRMVIEAHGAPPGVERELNVKYANAFNDAVQAFAAVHKDSWASSSQSIINNYAQQWQFNDPGNPLIDLVKEKKTLGPRGQNENNPLNLKSPGENKFQSFQNKSEGIKASYSQLLKYHDGSSANTDRPLESPQEMLRLWNNQAEKGSATDKQYAANVAKYSGLDVTKPIDRNDTDSWVDLIYGMSIAEGSKGLTRKEIRLALKE